MSSGETYEQERLDLLTKLSMVKSRQEPFFDRLTALASEVIGVPVTLVSMVADDHRYFKSEHGIAEPYKTKRLTPLAYSFCRHVVSSRAPLIVDDARRHPVLRGNPGIKALNMVAYLGMPLMIEDEHYLGAFCAIDEKPRDWTDADIRIVEAFSEAINAEICARLTAHQANRLNVYIHTARGRLDELERDIRAAQGDTDTIIARLHELRDELKGQFL